VYGLEVNSNCFGCGICEEICPMDCIRTDAEEKPYLAFDECWYCGACEKECPAGALKIQIPFLIC